MDRVCMGRVGYGPSLSWAEVVMGRDVQLPLLREIITFLDYLNDKVFRLYSVVKFDPLLYHIHILLG